MKKTNRLLFILYSLAAICWTISAFLSFSDGKIAIGWLNITCACLFSFLAILYARNYKKENRKG